MEYGEDDERRWMLREKDEEAEEPELIDVSLCYYCGEIANGIDHVIPQVVIKTYEATQDKELLKKLYGDRVLKVPACKECNCLLGATIQPTLRARKSILKEKLRKRYRELLLTPDWEEEEFREIGDGLKKYIKGSMAKRDRIKRRIRF